MLHLLNCDNYVKGTQNKEVKRYEFCSLSIEDTGNMDLSEYRAVDGLYRRPIYIYIYIYIYRYIYINTPEANTAHRSANAISFEPIAGLFLNLEKIRH